MLAHATLALVHGPPSGAGTKPSTIGGASDTGCGGASELTPCAEKEQAVNAARSAAQRTRSG